MIPPKSQCPLTHSPTELALSSALLVGIVLSYVPQQASILLGKSSEGLSPWFLLLGSIATISTVANVLLLQWHVVQCCSVWSPLGCFENALGVVQLTSQAVMFLVIGALYLRYFPAHLKYSAAAFASVEQDQAYDQVDESAPLLPQQQPATATASARLWVVSRRIALSVLAYLLLTTTLVALALALAPSPHLDPSPPSSPPKFAQPAPELVALAGIYGGIATLMSCLQFLPQIIHTYDAKDPGALSIGTMLMQTPGTLLLIYSLSLRPGTNVSTYLSYCVSATCQGTLLVLSLVYLYRKRAARRSAGDGEQHGRSGHEYRYGELVITDESNAGPDVASPVFATLRSSPNLVATSATSPPPLASTTIDVIDDDESLIEDPPAPSSHHHHLDSSSSPNALLPTAPPTITSSGLAPSLINPSSAHFIAHPSPPHSPLGSMVAVRSLRFGPGAGGASGMDSRSIDTMGSIASGGRTVESGGECVSESAVAHQQEVVVETEHEQKPAPATHDAHGVDDKFASAIQAHYSSLIASTVTVAPPTPCFELDDKVALDAALSAALPPSDADLLDNPSETDVVAVAIGQALPPSMDSVIEADKLAAAWDAKQSVSVRSLLNEPMGDADDGVGQAPPSVHRAHVALEAKAHVDECVQEVRAASPAAAEGDAGQPDEQEDEDDVDASEMSASASAKDMAPLASGADASVSLLSVGGGSSTTGSGSGSGSRRGKGKGKGTGNKGKNAKKKGGAKGGKVTKRQW